MAGRGTFTLIRRSSAKLSEDCTMTHPWPVTENEFLLDDALDIAMRYCRLIQPSTPASRSLRSTRSWMSGSSAFGTRSCWRTRLLQRSKTVIHWPTSYGGFAKQVSWGLEHGEEATTSAHGYPDHCQRCRPRQRRSQPRAIHGGLCNQRKRTERNSFVGLPKRIREQHARHDVPIPRGHRPPFTTAPVADSQRSSDPLLFTH